jgi:long-chain acyl-CoA synthetase
MTSFAPRSSHPSESGRHADTVGARILEAADSARGVALTRPGAEPITYAELGAAAREIAAGLTALGIVPGDRVAILAGTRPEWTIADAGSLCAGATVVPIYQTNSPEECEYVLAHAGVRAVFCEDLPQLAKVAAVRERCPALEHVFLIDGEAPETLSLADLRAAGAALVAGVDERLARVSPSDIATIVYTSGTTGPPKGCRITHSSLLATVSAYDAQLDMSGQEELVVYLFLPLAHALARVAQIAVLQTGGTLAYWGGQPDRIVAELAEVRPTHFPSVPRIYEKIHAAVVTGVAEQRLPKRLVFRWAMAEGRRHRTAERAGRQPGAIATLRHRLADRLVLARVRGVFGDRLVAALCGAAPVSAEVLEFFDACGVLTLEGYGMTETCAAATLNTPQAVRFGTVGRALPGTEIAVAEDGEVLMAGPHVFDGYHRDPDATAEVMSGRWLRSGDLGAIDEDGYLTITGRKKDLIITSSGKNISPENLESALRETRWISSAVVAGDRRPYLVALVTLDPDELPHLAAELGIAGDQASLAQDPHVREAIQRDVDAVNARFARIEQIKRFEILDRDFSQDKGEMTPTLKIKRAVVLEHFKDSVARLYGEDIS